MSPAPVSDAAGALHLIVTGTGPAEGGGGIAHVVPAYLAAIEGAEIRCSFVPTYHPRLKGGKLRLWARGLPRVLRQVRRARAAGRRPVVYSHAGNGPSLLREGLLLAAAKTAGASTMVQVHASQVIGYLPSRRKRALFSLALRGADLVCLLTPFWADQLRQAGVGRAWTVIPNPLTPALQAVANEPLIPPRPDDAPLQVLAMTRLVASKRVDVAIRALARLPQRYRLVVAGEGEAREELESLARSLDLGDRVRFAGWVSGAEKEALLRRTDIFCSPSTLDAFPIALVEAMCHGIPVVGVRWGGIPDVVPHERVGLLAEDARRELVAAALERLGDGALRQRMGEQGKRWVLELCSSESVGQRIGQAAWEAVRRGDP